MGAAVAHGRSPPARFDRAGVSARRRVSLQAVGAALPRGADSLCIISMAAIAVVGATRRPRPGGAAGIPDHRQSDDRLEPSARVADIVAYAGPPWGAGRGSGRDGEGRAFQPALAARFDRRAARGGGDSRAGGDGPRLRLGLAQSARGPAALVRAFVVYLLLRAGGRILRCA